MTRRERAGDADDDVAASAARRRAARAPCARAADRAGRAQHLEQLLDDRLRVCALAAAQRDDVVDDLGGGAGDAGEREHLARHRAAIAVDRVHRAVAADEHEPLADIDRCRALRTDPGVGHAFAYHADVASAGE